MSSIDIGAFGVERAKRIVEVLDGKTYLNLKVTHYPLNGERVLNISTNKEISLDEFKDFLMFTLAAHL